MSLPSAYELEKVKEVCKLLEASPELIHEPQLDFFRHFIHSFTVPPPPPAIEELSDAEEDDPEVVPPDEIEASQEMGDAAFEPTDAQLEQASEAKMAASEALAAGDAARAITQYTTAIKLGPSALVYANRANAYLKLKKPNAAKKDCDAALQINPDSAKAFKMRGKANRMLGAWEASSPQTLFFPLFPPFVFESDARSVGREVSHSESQRETFVKKTTFTLALFPTILPTMLPNGLPTVSRTHASRSPSLPCRLAICHFPHIYGTRSRFPPCENILAGHGLMMPC